MVGGIGFEPMTSAMSTQRSNQSELTAHVLNFTRALKIKSKKLFSFILFCHKAKNDKINYYENTKDCCGDRRFFTEKIQGNSCCKRTIFYGTKKNKTFSDRTFK